MIVNTRGQYAEHVQAHGQPGILVLYKVGEICYKERSCTRGIKALGRDAHAMQEKHP